MIRFIVKRKQKLVSGAQVEDLHHIDGSVSALEECLKSGGFSDKEYDYHELVGVEIVEADAQKGCRFCRGANEMIFLYCGMCGKDLRTALDNKP